MTIDKIYAEPIPGYIENPRVELLPGGYSSAPYRLIEKAVYWSKVLNRYVEIPKGFESDLLSTPWITWRMFPPGGFGKRAAIVHDYLVTTKPDWATSKQSANVFKEALNIDFAIYTADFNGLRGRVRKRWLKTKIRLMVAGVRVAGPKWP